MKTRQVIICITLFLCLNSFGQHSKTVSIQKQFQNISSQVAANQKNHGTVL